MAVWRGVLAYLIFDDLPNQMTGVGIAVIVASGLYVIDRARLAHLAARGVPAQ